MELLKAWENLKVDNPKLRIRNAAKELGVSELELLVLKSGENVIKLNNDFKNILLEIENLGNVTAITRNDDVVHERKGIYLNPSFHGIHVGLFVGADIDLRLFLTCWKSVYAVTEGEDDKKRYSIHFFAKDGQAVHKIYLHEKSNLGAYHKLVENYKSEDQPTTEDIEDTKPKEIEKPDSEIEVKEFQDKWLSLKDTHDFFGMLKKYEVTRTQALRIAPEGKTKKISNDSTRNLLELASKEQVSIMVFVGNQGAIQIHTGEVKKLMDYGEWFNVLDPDFNLHLRESSISETWLVKKPTEDGTITSVEVFDEKGELIVQFFGKRKPGIPELETWRTICSQL
jgi:putative hemin transport protein